MENQTNTVSEEIISEQKKKFQQDLEKNSNEDYQKNDLEILQNKFNNLRLVCFALILLLGLLTSFSFSSQSFLEWQVRQTIEKNFMGNRPSSKDLDNGKLKGLVGALADPYSEFLTVEDTKEAEDRLNNRYVGIGIQFDFQNGIKIQKILKNSPASRANLQVGDELVAVNGQKVEEIKVTELADKIRGEAGTTVKIDVKRKISNNSQISNSTENSNQNSQNPIFLNSSQSLENSISLNNSLNNSKSLSSLTSNSSSNSTSNSADFQILTMEIQRAQIVGELVELEVRGETGIITISSFGDDLDKKMSKIASQIIANPQIKNLIIDLRGNSGGLLGQTVEVVSYFLNTGSVIVQEKSKTETKKLYSVVKNPNLTNYPLKILIDGNSASASEIMAAALRDNRGILLIGQQSFGKGVVQSVFNLSGGNKLKLTIEEWLTPNGLQINKNGLLPDKVVPQGEDILEFTLKQ
jgi:carboxyl-terminal processing protease